MAHSSDKILDEFGLFSVRPMIEDLYASVLLVTELVAAMVATLVEARITAQIHFCSADCCVDEFGVIVGRAIAKHN